MFAGTGRQAMRPVRSEESSAALFENAEMFLNAIKSAFQKQGQRIDLGDVHFDEVAFQANALGDAGTDFAALPASLVRILVSILSPGQYFLSLRSLSDAVLEYTVRRALGVFDVTFAIVHRREAPAIKYLRVLPAPILVHANRRSRPSASKCVGFHSWAVPPRQHG